jgi:hypothetical protein
MQKLINFIDQNINQFLPLKNIGIKIYDIIDFDTDVIEYLKLSYYLYKNICVYYVEEDEFFEEGIWVEYMSDEDNNNDAILI